jgi:prepilin-type N-terminal cleavage/methylation domain-containing protein
VRKERKGYTLFEIIVVMAIILVAGAVAVPTIRNMMGDTPVKAAADQVKSRLAEARAKAMEEGKPYRFEVRGDNTFRVGPDDDFEGPSVLDDTLPRDVSFSQGGNNNNTQNGNGSSSVVFLPDGSASSDFDLPLTQQGSAPVTLKLNKTTGAANVQR